MYNYRFTLVLAAATTLLLALSPCACNVPVYRYALERWPADTYDLILYYEDALSPEQQQIATQLLQNSVEGTGGWNYRVSLADGNEESQYSLQKWIHENQIDSPCMLMRYPPHLGIPTIVDFSPFTEGSIHSLVESPVRHELSTRLVDGHTAVWIFLESGNRTKDDFLFQNLNRQLADLEKNLRLPDLSDVSDADSIELDDSKWKDSKWKDSESPLQIKFSTLRVSRNDPQERSLFHQLIHSEPDLEQYGNVPLLFPVFGRGRILYALVDQGITEENIREAAEFMIGPCTCLIKDQNGGIDLLLPINWENRLHHFLVKDRTSPPPFGLAEIASVSAQEGVPPELSSINESSPSSSKVQRNLFIGFGILLGINGIIATMFMKKFRKSGLRIQLFWFSLMMGGVGIPEISTPPAWAEDWPMWRYDAQRTAMSPQSFPDLTDRLNLYWVREYPPLEPVWDDPLNRDLMQYDTGYEPVVMGKTLFMGSNALDRLVAIDTESGQEKWSFFSNGPIRFPPVAVQGRVYFVSDDGFLYCVDAEKGTLIWKYCGIPQVRLILGNERLISTWCARGGPVWKDGVIYFGAGIWPFMGVFVFAIDAQTGDEIWVNDSSSSIFTKQPHNSPSFASVAPQGTLAISGDRLLVPGGRSVPACFDLHTGELLYYRLAENGKTGGAFVCAIGDHFFNYYRDQIVNLFDLRSGDRLIDKIGAIPVLTDTTLYCQGKEITALDFSSLRQIEKMKTVKSESSSEITTVTEIVWTLDTLWKYQVDATGDLIQSGHHLFAGGRNQVSAVNLNKIRAQKPALDWKAKIEGDVSRLLAADDKLFVVTREGKLYCFGLQPRGKAVFPWMTRKNPIPDRKVEEVKSILTEMEIQDGYALVYGDEHGDQIDALANHSDLRIIAFESDASKVQMLRNRFVSQGMYGKRLTIMEGTLPQLSAPPYLANLTMIDSSKTSFLLDRDTLSQLYNQTRPYGGRICIRIDSENRDPIVELVEDLSLPKSRIVESDSYLQIVREGALPDTDNWTHQYGDIANTVKSDDRLVKLPLGILWFGGSSNLDVLPRHGHGPPEQVVDGRLFIQGMNNLSARDVYTGRVLWKRELPNLDTYGVFYDDTYQDMPLSTEYNQIHIPGANARGTNYVATSDRVYIIEDNACRVLDPRTGQDVRTIHLPPDQTSEEPLQWGYIGVYEDYLIAGAGLVSYMDFIQIDPATAKKRLPFYNLDTNSSKTLVVMNRYTGEVVWTYRSERGLRHNAIVAGNGKLFCIDKMPDLAEQTLKRRGMASSGASRLLAFDIHNGQRLWFEDEEVFGSWLSYSEDEDILIEAVRNSRDMVVGEPREKLAGYRGSTGAALWIHDATYGGPCILHGQTIITEPYAFDLLTGKQKMRQNPLTGEEIPWNYTRQYGCNYAIASEYMMTFRSAAAGFFDLEQDAGTGNFGGFKSGCTSNLIAADGVLNAPDYTRTCSCSYQNQTSLAMIHDPHVEMWTYNDIDLGQAPIERLGINLGAPGDRRSESGTLWLEYPVVGGPSPELDIQVESKDPVYFHHHTSRMKGGVIPWVTASGLKGAQRIILPLRSENSDVIYPEVRYYTVRLYFAEPDSWKEGERVFTVLLQGRRVLPDFDIARETKSSRFGLCKEFSHIPVLQRLEIELDPSPSSKIAETILCGIELLSEKIPQSTVKNHTPSHEDSSIIVK